MNKINIPLLLTIAVTVLLTLQLKSCFTKSIPNEKLIRTEEQIKAKEEKRISDSLLMDAYIQIKNDSIFTLKEQLLNNGVRLQVNKNNYDKIKPVVIDYSREQLRAEALRYPVPSD